MAEQLRAIDELLALSSSGSIADEIEWRVRNREAFVAARQSDSIGVEPREAAVDAANTVIHG